MKQQLIDSILSGRTADDDVINILKRFPDEAYNEFTDIITQTEENGTIWVTRHIQKMCKKYLSDDRELMKKIREDEENE